MPAGFESKAGFVREAIVFTKVWPSASPAVITDLLPLLSEDVQAQVDQQSLVTRQSRSVPEFSKVIRQSSTGTVTTRLTYEGMEFFFTAAMGHEAPRISGTLMPEEIEPGISYRHLIEFDRDINQRGWTASNGFVAGPTPVGDGLIAGQQKIRRGTFAVFKNSTVWETKSAMVNTLNVQVGPAGVQVSMQLIGHDINFGSVVNAGLGALACSTNTPVVFRDCVLYFAPSGGDVYLNAVGDFNGFQFTINNNLQSINTKRTGLNMEEPQAGGARTVTGGFSLPRYAGFDLLLENQTNEVGHMLLECTGAEIPGTTNPDNLTIRFWFPAVNLTGAQIPTSGPGQLVQNYSFMALSGLTAPSFPETVFSTPLAVEIINTNGDHTLLD